MNENGKENELMQYVTVLPRYTGMLHMKFLCKYFEIVVLDFEQIIAVLKSQF